MLFPHSAVHRKRNLLSQMSAPEYHRKSRRFFVLTALSRRPVFSSQGLSPLRRSYGKAHNHFRVLFAIGFPSWKSPTVFLQGKILPIIALRADSYLYARRLLFPVPLARRSDLLFPGVSFGTVTHTRSVSIHSTELNPIYKLFSLLYFRSLCRAVLHL